MKDRRIYLLDPKQLTPETIAVTFAKTSRSPKPFDSIAAELTEARSAEFHEKWVVGYGHASVAEHAVLHVALENVSRLAIETIEGNRLASYTEK
jgi:thymidylate synthase ThyX